VIGEPSVHVIDPLDREAARTKRSRQLIEAHVVSGLE
jgi:hypothetical protein